MLIRQTDLLVSVQVNWASDQVDKSLPAFFCCFLHEVFVRQLSGYEIPFKGTAYWLR